MKPNLICCPRFRKRNCRVLPKSKVYLMVGLALALTMLVNVGEISHHVRSRWLQTVAQSLYGGGRSIDQFGMANPFPVNFPDNRSLHGTEDGYSNDVIMNLSNDGSNSNTEVGVLLEDGEERSMNLNNVTLYLDDGSSNARAPPGDAQPAKELPLKNLTPSNQNSTSGPSVQRSAVEKQTKKLGDVVEMNNMTVITTESPAVVRNLISATQPLSKKASTPIAAAATKTSTQEPSTTLNSSQVAGKTACSEVKLSQLVGRFQPSMKEESQEDILRLIPEIQIGGTYEPTDCIADEKTAIIIPYRDRWHHLHILLPVLLPMLKRQKVAFTLFIVAQEPPETFNKGLLFNAGFIEALKLGNFSCFILHDVDMVPADDRNLYRCDRNNPTHFGVSIDKFKFKLPYSGLFGGVTAFTREQFQKVNGASNMYFGWGAEDDDLRERILNKQYKMSRKSPGTAVYYMVKHNQKEAGWEVNNKRRQIFKMARQRQDIDGLNSVVYNTASIKRLPLYTWINVNIDESKVLQTVPFHLREGPPAQRPAMQGSIQGYLPKSKSG